MNSQFGFKGFKSVNLVPLIGKPGQSILPVNCLYIFVVNGIKCCYLGVTLFLLSFLQNFPSLFSLLHLHPPYCLYYLSPIFFLPHCWPTILSFNNLPPASSHISPSPPFTILFHSFFLSPLFIYLFLSFLSFFSSSLSLHNPEDYNFHSTVSCYKHQ